MRPRHGLLLAATGTAAGLATLLASPVAADPGDQDESGQVTVVPGDQLGEIAQPRVRMDAAYSQRSSSASNSDTSRTIGGSANRPRSGPVCVYEPLTWDAAETDGPGTVEALHALFGSQYAGSRGGDESRAFRRICDGVAQGWVTGTGIPGAPGGTAVVLPTPAELAARAREELALPLPVPGRSPNVRLADGRSATLVNEHTWVWTDPAAWRPQRERVQVGPVWAEVTATPTRLTVDPGMGLAATTCAGPGTPYDRAYGMHAASPDCGVVYARSSYGMPGGVTTAEYAITWSVSWVGSTGASDEGGELPDMISRATERFAVAEAQSLRSR